LAGLRDVTCWKTLYHRRSCLAQRPRRAKLPLSDLQVLVQLTFDDHGQKFSALEASFDGREAKVDVKSSLLEWSCPTLYFPLEWQAEADFGWEQQNEYHQFRGLAALHDLSKASLTVTLFRGASQRLCRLCFEEGLDDPHDLEGFCFRVGNDWRIPVLDTDLGPTNVYYDLKFVMAFDQHKPAGERVSWRFIMSAATFLERSYTHADGAEKSDAALDLEGLQSALAMMKWE